MRVAFGREYHDRVLDVLAERIRPRILRAPSRLHPVARQLDEYFAGTRRGFDIPLDLRLPTGSAAPCSTTSGPSRTGRRRATRRRRRRRQPPTAVRAAGSACATNPLPLVVPCHRVVRSDGSIRQ